MKNFKGNLVLGHMKGSASACRRRDGFTLIELLVVVAIIGILASVVLASLNSARVKSADAAVKSNLHSAANQAELFFLSNANSYLPSGGTAITTPATCPTTAGANMVSGDPNVLAAIKEAVLSGGNGSSCYNTSAGYAIAVGLKSNAATSWCVDNFGASRQVNSAPGSAITTGACN